MAITATYVDADTFTVNTDRTAEFSVGRRVKCDCGVDGYKYGTIDSSSYSAVTTVNLSSGSDNLTSNLTEVEYGIQSEGDTGSVPRHIHEGGEGDGGSIRPYVKVSDVKANTTSGGTFTTGAWRTRDLNTKDSDDDDICVLSSNQIVLDAGDYECRISAPAYQVSDHKIKLRNVTGSADILIGTSEFNFASGTYAQTRSFVVGKFTIVAGQSLEVQHYSGATGTTNGFGYPCGFGVDEVYTIAEFWKVG